MSGEEPVLPAVPDLIAVVHAYADRDQVAVFWAGKSLPNRGVAAVLRAAADAVVRGRLSLVEDEAPE